MMEINQNVDYCDRNRFSFSPSEAEEILLAIPFRHFVIVSVRRAIRQSIASSESREGEEKLLERSWDRRRRTTIINYKILDRGLWRSVQVLVLFICNSALPAMKHFATRFRNTIYDNYSTFLLIHGK